MGMTYNDTYIHAIIVFVLCVMCYFHLLYSRSDPLETTCILDALCTECHLFYVCSVTFSSGLVIDLLTLDDVFNGHDVQNTIRFIFCVL